MRRERDHLIKKGWPSTAGSHRRERLQPQSSLAEPRFLPLLFIMVLQYETRFVQHDRHVFVLLSLPLIVTRENLPIPELDPS